MESGASKQHHHGDIGCTQQPTAKSIAQESSEDSNNVQSKQTLVQSQPISQEGDSTNGMTTLPTDIKWHVLHSATLNDYKLNHPVLSDDLDTMFYQMEALRNFVDGSLSRHGGHASVSEIVGGLLKTSLRPYASEGTFDPVTFTTLINFTADIEGAKVLQQFAQQCFKDFYELTDQRNEYEAETEDFTCFDLLSSALATIRHFADVHNGFCSACAKAGVIPMCLENIQRFDAELQLENEDEEPEKVIIAGICVDILYNISRRVRDPEVFSNCEETLLRLTKVKMRSIACTSLLCLGYMVNEDTNHLILADENLLSFIIEMLDEALLSEDRRSNEYSAKELAEGLSHLAINDTNKKVLGNKGAVHVLISVLKTSNEDEEKASAARALWMLAFDDNNKDAIRQETGSLEMLRELQETKDQDVQRAAAGALWELEGKKSRTVEKRENSGNHVMISYQWDNQEVLIEVKNRLQASGYRVWMDVAQIRGSILEAMATAVEDASVVLVCFSQKYKESPNCRSEAEYAYQLRKDIIPLKMQHKYKPDGWLGILLGTKHWIDFQNKHVIETAVRKLIKELGGRGKDVDKVDGSAEPEVRVEKAEIVTAQPSAPAVSGWTNKEVKQWLEEIGLEKVCREDISEVNGQTLIDLQRLREECAEYFYRCLEQNLNLRNMVDVFKFTKELQKLLSEY